MSKKENYVCEECGDPGDAEMCHLCVKRKERLQDAINLLLLDDSELDPDGNRFGFRLHEFSLELIATSLIGTAQEHEEHRDNESLDAEVREKHDEVARHAMALYTLFLEHLREFDRQSCCTTGVRTTPARIPQRITRHNQTRSEELNHPVAG